MSAVTGHLQFISWPVIGTVLLFLVILIAVCRNYHVKTGLRLGWFSFFLETERNQSSPRNEAAPDPK